MANLELLSVLLIGRRRNTPTWCKTEYLIVQWSSAFRHRLLNSLPTMTAQKNKRIIGLDMHPDVFCAAALVGDEAINARLLWLHDRMKTQELEGWAKKHLQAGDILVLEASGNSFDVAGRLHACGHRAIVLESTQASKIKHNFCNDDRQSAVKLARVYLSGLAKEVWQPDARTRERRDIFFAHRNAVKDSTSARNRLRGFLNEHGVRLPAGTPLTRESTE